ncbi:hypothetical protein C8A01DRAFT_31833 [Parachaetomium inaequale]|uniref:Uncharacterized protein n=1 Tax=Parachaetomium inaequale TaxID=2588326 RepID=A0AAN6PSW1_9PEZI|nr:hypothetical protein C8A01DRAFT_31833 [Parachaetomium inaequale]
MAGNGLDPNQVTALQKRFSGLDDQLHYQKGHTIYNKYATYKAADKAAGTASTAYKGEAAKLKATKPYDPNQKRGNVGGTTYYQAGHRTLAPLAGTASQTAQYHYERRDSFNVKYKDVLTAQGPKVYQNHVEAAGSAQASATKYAGLQQKHQAHS